MKQFILLVGLFLGIGLASAQCTQAASGFGNNATITSYNVLGDVSITYGDNQVTFKTGSNYSTASGPDVRVYLVASGGRTDAQLIGINPESLPNIPFGLVGFSGVQQFTANVPNTVDLSTYDTVFFFCLEFTQFWDFGKITPINVTACENHLSVDGLQKVNNFSISPNPSNGLLTMNGDRSKVASYKLFNLLGLEVAASENITADLDFSELPSGVYSLVLYSETSYEIEKIIIQ